MNRNRRKPFKSFLPVKLETELCHLEHFDPAREIKSKKKMQNLKTKFKCKFPKSLHTSIKMISLLSKILKYLLGFFAVLLALDGGVEIESILTISSTFTQALHRSSCNSFLIDRHKSKSNSILFGPSITLK